jgi:tRNA dimethylallyltransferase
LAELPEADAAVRAAIDGEALEKGWPAMHAQLAQIDARAAARIQRNDAQRIQRALEVFRLSGRTLSELHDAATPADPGLAFSAFAWVPDDRERLYAAIERRFRAMLDAGLLDEVTTLYKRGDLHARLPSIRSVGYRQLWEHLCGEVDLTGATTNAILATRHLARRQLVWLRSESELNWMNALDSNAAAQMETHLKALH